MTEFFVLDDDDARLVARLVAREVSRVGVDRFPSSVVSFVAAIADHSTALAVIVVDGSSTATEDERMSFAAVSAKLDVSTSTLTRWCRDGLLVKVGRQITRSSVDRLLASGSAGPSDLQASLRSARLQSVNPAPKGAVRVQRRAGGER